jgi:hypothetical protein
MRVCPLFPDVDVYPSDSARCGQGSGVTTQTATQIPRGRRALPELSSGAAWKTYEQQRTESAASHLWKSD